MKREASRIVGWVVFALLVGVPGAYAAGVTAGTSVSNTATANFSIGSVSQPPVTSQAVAFVVDRKIIFTVVAQDATYVSVAPTATTSQPLKFNVTNSSNDTVDFSLAYVQDVTGSADAFGGGTDSFDTTNIRLYRDNGNGTFGPEDAQVTFLDEVPADGTVTVFVVSDMPTPLPTNNSISSGTLTATAAIAGTGGALGANHVQTSGPDTSGVDTVFADASGDTDVSSDGKHSDDSAYKIATPTLTATKSFTLVSDPVNGIANPKAIPGAVVEYCIKIENNGSATADDVTMTDTVPTGTTFVPGSIVAGGTTCVTGISEDDDATGTDDILSPTENTGNITGQVVTTQVKSLAAAGATVSRFKVTINP